MAVRPCTQNICDILGLDLPFPPRHESSARGSVRDKKRCYEFANTRRRKKEGEKGKYQTKINFCQLTLHLGKKSIISIIAATAVSPISAITSIAEVATSAATHATAHSTHHATASCVGRVEEQLDVTVLHVLIRKEK